MTLPWQSSEIFRLLAADFWLSKFLLVQVSLYEHSYLSSKQGQQIESWRGSQNSPKLCQSIKPLQGKFLQNWAMCLSWGKCCYIFRCLNTMYFYSSYVMQLRMCCQLPGLGCRSYNSWARNFSAEAAAGCWFSVLPSHHQRWLDSYLRGLQITPTCGLLL